MTTLGSVARACVLSLAFAIGATTGACGGDGRSEAPAADLALSTASLSLASEVHYFDAATRLKSFNAAKGSRARRVR